ncbi:MAG: AAC(3) family N-acetyltransferase [Treponemataceae bacterium]|nr:AAC(3) family N-acetyltransferase [Treponemataceae bacterium]
MASEYRTAADGRALVLREDIEAAVRSLGVDAGDSLMVHCSLSKIGFVCGGAQVVVEALMHCVGADGTLMMPSQSWKNLDPSSGVHWQEPEEWYEAIRENWPAYDRRITPTNTMGAVAELFRTWPGTLRSGHPARSVAAWGRHAARLTEHHDVSDIFGESSPLGKFYALDGKILLVGVGYDKNTMLHLADVRADYPSKHDVEESSAMLVDGQRKWVSYRTLFVDGGDFEEIGAAFEKECPDAVRRTMLGNAELRLMRARLLVDFAVQWIERNRR